ncbi:AI-2E family transporter [Shimia biformata]|uniref:AI-2E family transporter n=1 Tax=Shimia biformata TaxID=1294299 RepID=UPI0019500926|nr:AI-2E family transporter [Shimia biformata]
MNRDSQLHMIAASLAIIATIAMGWFLNSAQAILVPIVLGALMAFLLDGISRGLERIPLYGRVPVGFRVAITSLVLFVLLIIGVAFFARNMEPVVRALPSYLENLSLLASQIAGRFDYEVEITWQSLNKLLFDSVNLNVIVRYTLNSLSYSAGYLIVVFLYAILFLLEKNVLRAKIGHIVEDAEAETNVWSTFDLITSQIGTYFTMKTLVNTVLGILCYVIFLLFGIEFAGFFALLTAIFNYIPYVGSWIAVALPMLFATGQFGLGWEVPVLLVLTGGVQMAIGYFWEPRLMGKSMNLSPVVVLISLAAWTAIWGLAGAILSVILTSGVMTVLGLFPSTRPIAILMTNTGEPPVEVLEGRRRDR